MKTLFRIVCAVLALLCVFFSMDQFLVGNTVEGLILGVSALMFNAAWSYHIFYGQETNR